jgi:hypothetical protein
MLAANLTSVLGREMKIFRQTNTRICAPPWSIPFKPAYKKDFFKVSVGSHSPWLGNHHGQYMGNGLNCQIKGNINGSQSGNESFPIHAQFIIGKSWEIIRLAIHDPFSLPIDWEVN